MNALMSKTHLLISVVVVALVSVSCEKKAIDCRKFAFAPACRGIMVKRDSETVIPIKRSTDADRQSMETHMDHRIGQVEVVLGQIKILLHQMLSRNSDVRTCSAFNWLKNLILDNKIMDIIEQ